MRESARLRQSLSAKKVVVMLCLLLLFIGPTALFTKPAAAVTTTNCTTVNGVPTSNCINSSGGGAANWGMQRKVFFDQGYWWIFWATGVGAQGIYYQSCPATTATSCATNGAWSTPATLTIAGSAGSAGAQVFDMVLSKNTLFYVIAPTAGATTTFVWGAINLPANGIIVPGSFVVQDNSISLGAVFGTGTTRSSIAIDGLGDLWVAITTDISNGGATWYESVYECTNSVIVNPVPCTIAGNWASTQKSFQLFDATGTYISPPDLLNVTVGAVSYMTLSYLNLHTDQSGGPYDIYVSQADTVLAGIIQWTTPCGGTAAAPLPCQAPSNTAGIPGTTFSPANANNGAQFSAVASVDTVYAVATTNAVLVEFSYTVGTGFTTATYTQAAPLNAAPTLSLAGSNIVLTYYDGNNHWWTFSSITVANFKTGSIGWTGGGCNGSCLTLNTDGLTNSGLGSGDASPVSYSIGGLNLIGVFWDAGYGNGAPVLSTNRMRFAVESVTNSGAAGTVPFPVTLSLSYYQYNFPGSPRFGVSPQNYFTITYTVCNEGGCSGPGVAQYTSSSGAPLTITNVQAYTEWFVTAQTSGSTNGEKWCLLYGNNCAGVFSGWGASDGLTQSYYYYDQTAQSNLYAIATPGLYSSWATATASVGTSNYDMVSSNVNGFISYSNPNSGTNSPWALPRASVIATQGVDESVQFVRSRDVLPGCSQQTIYPGTLAGATCSPTTAFGTLSTIPITASYPTVPGIPAPIVKYVPLTISNSQDAATPAGFQTMLTVDSASFTPYEATNLQNVEFFANGGAILPSWLESGNLNTATSSVYWVNLGALTIPAGTVGSTVAGPLTTTVNTNPMVLQDGGAAWAVNQWVGYYLEYTGGPAAGQFEPITSNTAVSITVAAPFNPAPLVAGGDTFSIVNVVPSTQTIYMGFGPIATSFFTNAAGPVGEAPTLSPTYGFYDNGAVVFSKYWDFAGNSLPAAFTTTFFSGVTSNPTTNVLLKDTPAAWTTNQWTGDYLQYTSGPALGQSIQVFSNTFNTITTAVAFNPAPTPGGGDNFVITTGNGILVNNGVTFTGTQMSLFESTAGTYSDTAITESNIQVPVTPNPGSGGILVVNAESTSFGITTAGSTKVLLMDTSAAWVVNQWVGDYLQYTTGPNAGLSLIITANAATTITTAAFTNNPTAAGGDNFVIKVPAQTSQYTAGNWYNGGANCLTAGFACNGFDIDVNAVPSNQFRSVANGLTTAEPANAVPGISTYIAGGSSQTATYFSGTTSSATNILATQLGAGWTAGQFVGDFLRYTSGPAAGQTLLITANTANTITTAAFAPIPTPAGGDNFVVILGYTQQTVNELQSKQVSYIATNVPPAGNNYYLAMGATANQIFSFNWLRQRAYPPSGVMPTVSIGPATTVGAPATKVLAYAPVTLTNSQAVATPPYFQADVNVTSSSPAFFMGVTSSTASTAGSSGVTTGPTSANILTDAGASWVVNQWAGHSLEYVTGPAAGETIAIASNTGNTITTTTSFAPAPTPGGGDGFTILATSTLTDSSAAWVVNAYVGDYLLYTSGPASGQWLQITANTATTLTTIAPNPAPTAAGGDNFAINIGYGRYEASTLQNVEFFTCSGPCSAGATIIPSWLESGASNTASNSVYWVNLPSSIASGGNMMIYIGFVDYGKNLFSATGYTGGAAGLGPSYGIYDNGAVVFNFYDNFVGTSLSPQWAPTTNINSNQGVNVALGQLVGNTNYQNEHAGTVYLNNTLNPSGAALDSSGDLWVADSGFNRVLEFVPGTAPCAPTTFCSGMPASVVLGQGSFGASNAGTTANTLSNPRGLAFDSSGNLWVADTGNSRILKYVPPFTNGMAATIVLGQLNLVSGAANQGGATSATDLSGPRALIFDGSGNMWVADTGNSRVIQYLKGAGFTTDEAATTAIGQANMLGGGPGTSPIRLSSPSGLALSGGNLWVSDTINNRILEYKAPLVTSEAAVLELGQGPALFTGVTTGATNTILTDAGQAWVPSAFLNYYLEYTSGPAAGQALQITANTANTITTAAFLPVPTPGGGDNFVVVPYQTSNANQGLAFPTGQTLNTPLGLAADGAGNIWIADSGNNRVLRYSAPSIVGQGASLVMGQASFTSFAVSTSASGENVPRGVTFDSAGNLWVTDSNNNRVVQLPLGGGFTSDELATQLVGQFSFNLLPNPLNLYDPTSAAFDSSGNLWVADSGNNRVLEYANNGYQFYTGQSASVVLGQNKFTTNAPTTSITGLNDPTYLAFDSCGNLWVTDTGNNRLLEYQLPTPVVGNPCNTGSLSTGMAATLVIGQAGFNSGAPATTAGGLNNPHEIAFDSSGNLWVADTGNNRVLEYTKPLSIGEAATLVLGQNLFTTSSVNFGGLSASSLSSPYGVAFSAGNIWVADTGNNRILGFTPAFVNDGPSTTVIGQTFFNTNLAGTTGTTLRAPIGIGFDYWGDLWVADTGNNRVVQYQPTYNSLFSGMPYTLIEAEAFGSGIYAANQQGTVNGATMNYPLGVAFDGLGNLWVGDTGNNRVTSGATGSIVVNNGVIVRETSNWMGIMSRPTFNPMTSILEFYGYMSSQNSLNQVFGLNAPCNGAACTTVSPTPTPNGGNNRLYSFSTQTQGLQSWHVEYNGAAGAVVNTGLFSLPSTSPIISWTVPYTAPYPANGCANNGVPLYYLATFLTCSPSQGASTITSTYWALKNTTVQMVNAIPGQPEQRWQAADNLLGWTVTAGYQMEAAVPYYLQYGNVFQIQSGGKVLNILPGITFVLYGTQYGVQYSPLVTLGSAVLSKNLYVDAGTVVSFPETGSGAASGSRWENSNNQSQTVVVGTLNPNTQGSCTTLCTATYFQQYQQYLQYKTSDLTALPNGQVPLITYVSFAKDFTVPIPSSTSTVWLDALTTATGTQSIASPSTQFSGTTTGGTLPATLKDASASWIANQFVGDFLTYTSGLASGQSLLIISNTPTSITTASGFAPPPTGGGGDTFNVIAMTQRWASTTGQWTITCSNTQAPCLSTTGVTTLGTTSTILQDTSVAWGANAWVGYYLTYTSGPAKGLTEPITANSATSLTTPAFSTNPSGMGDSFEITGGIPNPVLYFHQYEQLVSPYKTSDYNPVTSLTIPFLSYTANNTLTQIQIKPASGLVLVWADANTASSATTPLPGAVGERWVPSIGTWTLTGSNLNGGAVGIIGPFGNTSILYDHQYQITFVTVPIGPTLSISACSYPLSTCSFVPQTSGVQVWQTTPLYVSTGGNSSYVPSGIGASAGECLKPPPYLGACSLLVSSNNAIAILSTSGTITAFFNLNQGVTFIQSGINESPTNPTAWVVTVTNSSCPVGICQWKGASSSGALAITLVCKTLPSCTYTYTVSSPVYSASGTSRFFVTPLEETGTFMLSPFVSSTSVSLTYLAQYKLTLLSDPAYAGAFSGSFTNATGVPASGVIPGVACAAPCESLALWLTPGSTGNFGVTIANPLIFSAPPTWSGWTGTNCPVGLPPACDTEGLIAVGAMTGPIIETANFQTPLLMTINPSSESAYIGETVTTDVDVFGGIGNVTIGAVIPPGLVGLVSINFYTVQNPGIQSNPLTFASSVFVNGASPTGQVIVMEVHVAQHATIYGALNFTVTAMSSGYALIGAAGAQAICTTTNKINCVYTLNIIAPTPTVIGNAQTPFAITTAGQSSLFFLNGHWLAFYYNGSSSGSGKLVVTTSIDANGSMWNPAQVVPAGSGIQGYGFAVMTSGTCPACYVYYVLTSANNSTAGLHWTYYYSDYASVNAMTGKLTWALASPQTQLIAAGTYVAGQPSIVAGVSGDVYVAVPTLSLSGGHWLWQVQVYFAAPATPATFGIALSWFFGYQTLPPLAVSALNVKEFSLTSMAFGNGVAVVDWTGNSQSLPYVTVLSDPPGIIEVDQCNVGPPVGLLTNSQNLPNWGSYVVYGAQSDVIANGNVVYFAGVNATNNVVKFFSWTYNGPGAAKGGCGAAMNGGWSGSQQINVGQPTNKLSDWHVSLSWSSGSIIIGYGVDTQLGFAIGTFGGGVWSWFVLPSVLGVTGIQGGLTAAFASSGGGSGTVGMIWVQKISDGLYAIEFALA